MPIFSVTNKASGKEEYRFEAQSLTELDLFPFSSFDYAEVIDAPAAQTPQLVYGGRRILSKLEFRRLFPDAARPYVDEFNATFESSTLLTADQKRDIRSGLEDFKAASEINLDDASISQILSLYVALGLITKTDMETILNG
jgi:hypothetical protein